MKTVDLNSLRHADLIFLFLKCSFFTLQAWFFKVKLKYIYILINKCVHISLKIKQIHKLIIYYINIYMNGDYVNYHGNNLYICWVF